MRYLFALAAVAAAVVLRALLDPVIGDGLPLVTLFGAVAAAVVLCGVWPAVLAAFVGYFASSYMFIEPRGSLRFGGPPDVVGLLAYLFTCALIIAAGESARRARARASDQKEVLRVTLGSIGDAVITTDNHGIITYLNPVAEHLTGWSQDAARRQPLDRVFRIVNEDTRKLVESPAVKALREGTIVGLANHTLLIRKDGTEVAIDDSAAPIRDDNGLVSGCVLIFRDVSGRRRLERAAAERLTTANLLASIIESSDDAIVSKTLDGTIRSWNTGAERLFGYTADETIGRHISMFIPPERLAEEDRIIASLTAGERIEHFETERLRRDGGHVTVSLTISPVRDGTGTIIGASKIARDITHQRQAEAEIRRLAAVVESSTDFVGICDVEGRPMYMNPAGLQMLGLESLDEARGLPFAEVFFPEDRAAILNDFLPRVVDHGYAEADLRFRHLKTGEPRWMAFKVIALRDGGGRIESYATVGQDVTDRRQLEDHLRRMAIDLAESNRQKTEFLATLAHELRNPLAPLRSALDLLNRADGDADRARLARETMDRQLSQMVRLVDDLLDVNRVMYNRLELRPIDLDIALVIHQAVEMSQPLIDHAGHQLRVVLPAEPLFLHADPVRLTQVFANLLNNSSKYTPPGGQLEISVQREDGQAVVRVKDSGAGIPADQLEQIFNMFNQVDRAPERAQGGLGIGLALVRRLVEMHGGSVRAHSDGPGQGSEFVVRLPALATAPAVGESLVPEAAAPVRRRVLVVDDNRDAADALALLLQHNGHETFVAYDGAEAFAAADQYRPDVMLLDIGLPGMNGHDVCRQMRQQPWGKRIRMIALTGWGQEDDRQKSREAGFDGHLVKPVEIAAVLQQFQRAPATS